MKIKKNESIEKILTRDVTTAHTDQKVSDIRKLLAEGKFHHMPVVSGKRLVGLISASDILAISVEGVGSDVRSMDAYLDHQFSVEGLMKTDLRTLPEKSTIADAAEILSDGDFHAVPVIGDEGELVGLVTSTDLIRFLRDLF
jgi:CBS domain-containing protein